MSMPRVVYYRQQRYGYDMQPQNGNYLRPVPPERRRRGGNLSVTFLGKKVRFIGKIQSNSVDHIELLNSKAAFLGTSVKTTLRIGQEGVEFTTKSKLFGKAPLVFVPLESIVKIVSDLHRPTILMIAVQSIEGFEIFGFHCKDKNDSSYLKHTFRQLIPEVVEDIRPDTNNNPPVVVSESRRNEPSTSESVVTKEQIVVSSEAHERSETPSASPRRPKVNGTVQHQQQIDSGISSDEHDKSIRSFRHNSGSFNSEFEQSSMASMAEEYQRENRELRDEVSRLTDEVRNLRLMFETSVGLDGSRENVSRVQQRVVTSSPVTTSNEEARVMVPDYRHIVLKKRSSSRRTRSEYVPSTAGSTYSDGIRLVAPPGRVFGLQEEEDYRAMQQERADRIRMQRRQSLTLPGGYQQQPLPPYAVPQARLMPGKGGRLYVSRSMTNLAARRPPPRSASSVYQLNRGYSTTTNSLPRRRVVSRSQLVDDDFAL